MEVHFCSPSAKSRWLSTFAASEQALASQGLQVTPVFFSVGQSSTGKWKLSFLQGAPWKESQEEANFISWITVTLTREKERNYLLNLHMLQSTCFRTWDRIWLLRKTVGSKGQSSAKRRTYQRHSRTSLKLWSNLHRRRPLAGLRMSGVIVCLAPLTSSS